MLSTVAGTLLLVITTQVPEEPAEIGAPPPGTSAVTQTPAAGLDLNRRLQEFKKRALIVRRINVQEAMRAQQEAGPFAMFRGPQSNIIVVDSKGEVVPDDRLGQIIEDEDLTNRYMWLGRQESMMLGLRFGAIGLLIASLPAGALLGAMVGAAVGIPLALQSNDWMRALGSAGIGLAIGAIVGILAGGLFLFMNIGLGLLLLFYSYYTRHMFYTGAVREHNTELAQELGLNPVQLGTEYFPSDRPAQR